MNEKIEIKEILDIILRHIWIFVICALVCSSAMYVKAVVFTPDRYLSTCSFTVSSIDYDKYNGDSTGVSITTLNASVELASHVAEIVKTDKVLTDLAREADCGVSAKDIKSIMSIANTENSAMLTLNFKALSPSVAYAVSEAAYKNIPSYVEDAGLKGSVKGWDSPVRPTKPVSKNPLKSGIIGLAIGVVLAFVISFLLEIIDGRIRQTDDLSQKYDVPVIGAIPRIIVEGNNGRRKAAKDETLK